MLCYVCAGEVSGAAEEGPPVSEASGNLASAGSNSSITALDLKIREAFVRSAISSMDACGTPALTWEAYLLMIRIWGEKFATEATTAKRTAQAPAAGQPDGKRAAGADAAAAAAQMHAHASYAQHYQQPHAAYAQHYQQPHAAQQQYYGGYDYSAYYAANPQAAAAAAAAYYPQYAYPQ